MHEYRARLENRDARVVIDNRGNLAVRANLYELRLELLLLANVHGMDRVLEPALLEHDRGLAAIRRRPGVEIDHSGTSFLRTLIIRCYHTDGSQPTIFLLRRSSEQRQNRELRAK